MYNYPVCPVCKSEDFGPVLQAKDTTVSNEMFQICHCRNCDQRFTNPVPEAEAIGPYYKSEAYISHSNTSQGLINRLYQTVRKITLRSKRKLVTGETGAVKGDILDIGSGAGAFLAEMQQSGWKAIGLEPDEDARTVAQADFGVESQEIDRLFELPENSVDAITMWHVLEHVHELDLYLEKMKSLLRSKGAIFIAVPNYTSWDARKYKERWAAYDVPRHLYHFAPVSMKVLIERHGLKVAKLKWMPFDSFYVSMLSERNHGGSVLRGIWNGFCSFLVAMRRTDRCSSIIYVVKK
ncbi:MAG: class I SAM-dependent methyltransferase [Bacteroidota bacterium]